MIGPRPTIISLSCAPADGWLLWGGMCRMSV
jgi:hypothetical protein